MRTMWKRSTWTRQSSTSSSPRQGSMRSKLKQSGHRLWINNKERHQPPDLDNGDLHSTEHPDDTQNDIPPYTLTDVVRSPQLTDGAGADPTQTCHATGVIVRWLVCAIGP
eukprot:5659283-Amphidinium_carterae.3